MEDLLSERSYELGGSGRSEIRLNHTEETILTDSQRQQLMGLADVVHSLQKIEGKDLDILEDIKIILPWGAITELTGSERAESLLKNYHHKAPLTATKLVLRRTSPTRGCLPWHVDGLYLTSVVQYTLNDDNSYIGGRLCFFTSMIGLFVPRRPSGNLSVHTKEMHAVSRLLSGVRYILFVLDDTNSLGGSKENIVKVETKFSEQYVCFNESLRVSS